MKEDTKVAITLWGIYLAVAVLGIWSTASGPLCEASVYKKALSEDDATWCMEFWFNRYQVGLTGVVAVAVAVVAALLAWEAAKRQINSAEDQNRKWKTLEICAQHESVSQVSTASRCLRKYYEERRGLSDEVLDSAILMANYLDGIAIGIDQNLYDEQLAKGHLRQIVKTHIEGIFPNSSDDLADRNNYELILKLNAKWNPEMTPAKGLP